MIEVGGESNGEQPGNDHESLQSTTPAVASLLQATQASGDLLAHSRAPQVRSMVSSAEASALEVATTVAVVTSSDVSLTGSPTSSSYQHYLAPATVSIGGHIQNITIPAQVSVTSPGVAVAAASPSQNLARILAAASQQGYSSPPAPGTSRAVTTVSGLLSSSSRLAATSPAALLATTQPPAQQQAIVMDTLTQDEQQRLLSYSSLMASPSPPRTLQRSPTTTTNALPPQFVVPPKQSTTNVLPVPPPPPPPASSPTASTSGVVAVSGPTRPGGLLQLVGVESPRAAKRIKLEEQPPANEEVAAMRQRVYEHRWRELQRNKERYVEHLTELFFLQNGGNMMDYFAWKRRPTPQLLALLRAHALDSEDEEDPARLLDTRPPSALLAATASSAAAATTAAAAAAAAVVTTTVIAGMLSSSSLMAMPAATSTTTVSTADAAMATATTLSAIASQLAASPGQPSVPATPPSSVPSPGPKGLADPCSSASSSSQQTPASAVLRPPSPLRVPAVATPTTGGSSPSKGGALRQPPSAAAGAAAPATPVTPAAAAASGSSASSLTLPASRLTTRQHSISAVYDSSIGSQEEIVERAKQEAYVMQRIAELRKDGMWSARRLPKVQEPPRAKAHWDYLLEEMVWLATDFAQERKWKKAAAKKCARMVLRYHQEREQRAERAEREELQRLRRVAAQVAKEIKQFWTNIEKLVEFKQQTRLEEKRKKALDLHLNFIMDQTEKYSSWLREGMGATNKDSTEASEATTPAQAPASPARSGSSNDEDFQPDASDSDDEETIDREETTAPTDQEEQSRELELLQKESELPIEQLLDSLPPEILERPASPLPHTNGGGNHKADEEEDDGGSSERSGSPIDVESTKADEEVDGADEADGGDDDFQVEDEEDDEETLEEQEEQEKTVDHNEELKELMMEGEMPLDALYEKYGGAYASDAEVPNAGGSSGEEEEDDDAADNERDSENSDEEMDEEEEEEDMDTSSEGEVQEDIGMEYLINPMSDEVDSEVKAENVTEDASGKGPTKEITDIAATAQSFQPKGNTLSTTQVQTKVPWLLKHSLREYQHIGLDWLVTMHDKKLNGILADEMGLGKTIQTISLLAHMACDKGIWGPHLIVVPTSVMLNWEMEFKKWCPAFKILTYYGIPKERKQKRQGWTKPNAFHVCITSYKLVVQDHQAFRRKKWKYLILDEAQHIKNFKSQRWQMLLNFQSSRRLLLTGTPLQNSLMELWSLMHFLMPSVFQSHREFREWFANPVTGMIEGSSDYNESLIKRLHKVLRPFLLRRLKCEVEKQLPKKYEHVVMCRLSNRQRYLYDDFMSQTKTKETLATGNFMSVINVLMQLRKVCNHPNMFEPRPIVSPFRMEGLVYYTASRVYDICKYDPFKHVSFSALNLLLADVELCLTAFAAHRIKKFQTSCHFVETIESHPPPPPRCPPGKIRLHIRTSTPSAQSGAARAASPMVAAGHHGPHHQRLVAASGAHHHAAGMVVRPGHQGVPGGGATFAMARHGAVLSQVHHPGGLQQQPQQQQQRLVVVSTPGTVTPRAHSPVVAAAPSSAGGGGSGEYMLQLVQKSNALAAAGGQPVMGSPITLQIQPPAHGTGPARVAVPFGIGRIVQTTTGQHLLLTPAQQTPQTMPDGTTAVQQQHQTVMLATSAGQTVVRTTTALSQMGRVVTSAAGSPASTQVSTIAGAKPVVRVAPMNVNSQATHAGATKTVNAKTTVVASVKSSGATSESSSQRSPFYLDTLESRRRQQRREKLRLLGHTNALRCAACPTYGRDLVEAVTVVHDTRPVVRSPWGGTGYVACLNAPSQGETQLWRYTRTLRSLVRTPPQLLDELRDMIDRFVFSVPKVTASRIEMRVSHPSPSSINAERVLEERLRDELGPRCAFLHPVMCSLQTQFPELRLIQYDCGKLQVLDKLLWQLRGGQHRVLIFTQMTRMLDVLEQFLNYHGHTYLRLDGSTRVDQRQALMERFNADRRIFCFILSTRSGGIGVNLTGADTVVFYDSDWNPTMDAQAQDRCHRIGQTRDVHIYRLISERTVEENILKKANQKRMLGDLAIEGGNFTTAFFKQNTLKDLFGTDFGLAVAEKSEESQREDRPIEPERPEKFSSVEFEKALGMAEEELDVQAAHTARAEAAAELAEFDESIPLDTDSRDEDKSQAEEELDKLMDQLTPVERYAMQFLESLQEPLTLEQLKQAEEEIEAQKKDWELGRLKAIKEEEERRAGYRDDEEAPALVYSREDAYTQIYISMNGHEQMPIWAPPTPPQDENDLYIDYSVGFLYEPSVMSESSLPAVYIKKEAKRLKVDPLSTVAAARKQKSRKEDAVHIPKSLFDRPTAAILKMRREAKLQKVKNLMVCGAGQLPPKALASLPSRPLAQQGGFLAARPLLDLSPDMPEWLIHEDWAILQVIQQLQDIPLNLTVLSPGHTPNWDLVADVVNTVSRIYRSPKQCKDRYESVIVPREEGKILYDTNPKKQKKTKGIYKTKNNKPMRTGQLFSQDCNQAFTMLYNTRFDTIRAVASKRTPTLKPTFTANPLVKNPKHAAVLADNGISYDQPLPPARLAAIRAERIAKEKQKSQMAAAAAAEAQRQQQAQQQQQHQQGQPQVLGHVAPASTQTLSQPAAVAAAQGVTGQAAAAVVAAASPAAAGVVAAASPATAAALLVQQQQQQQQVAATQAVLATLGQAQQLQPVAGQLSKNVTTVALAKSGGILVSTAVTATTAAAGGVVSAAPTFALTKVPVTAVATLSTAALRPQRPQPPVVTATTTMTVQEMVAVATGQVRGLPVSSAITTAGGSTPAVVSVTNLTSAQLQPAPQRISAVAAVSQVTAAQGVASVQGGRSLTASQLQAMRQGNFLRQHQQQQRMQQLKQQQLKRLQQQQQLAAAGTTQATVAVPVSLAGTAKVAVSAAVQQARPLSQQQQQQVQQQQQQASSAQQQQQQQQQAQQQQQQAVAAAVAAVKAATPLGAPKQQTAITRSLTEAEMAQLLKRRELQQKQMAAAHLLAQAQLQQQQQAQQQAGQQTQQVVAVSQQQQQSLACTVQTPVATLVKTVSAPSALGTSQTAVTIPVSAVTMAGVNINVSLAQQGKVTATSKPITTASVTPQQMQLRQLHIQQQLLQQQQQRKVTLQTQQKVAGLSQAQLPTGKAPTVATQLGTVQIVQQGSGQGAKATTLPSATAITVQQIIKQVLPVNQNFLVSSAVQSAAGGSSGGATTVSPATQVQLHAMLHKPAVSTVALAAPTVASSGATTATLVPTRIMALQQPPGQPTAVALKQGLQVITASAGTAQTSSYTVEGSAAAPLVASIVADAAAAAAALKPVEGGTLPKAIAVAVTTATGADNSVVPPNVTAPSSSETITRAVSVDVSAATVQAVQAAIEAARQQGSLPYTMRLRNNPPKPA
ncbi:helicase domino isoform X3 [Dermacentor andersoni]|uniref:helicase domino isoform X3 n=1 Tax=Dermacentor andersoni TaxID=34620 RepID=UPI0024165441|nr:helicase domino-like isoform X3 [Dermacentor andersoni]